MGVLPTSSRNWVLIIKKYTMAYSNLTNPGNYQLASFGQKGLKVLTAGVTVTGHFNVIQATGSASISATAVNGDNLVTLLVPAGSVVYGLFTSVTVVSGNALAYIA